MTSSRRQSRTAPQQTTVGRDDLIPPSIPHCTYHYRRPDMCPETHIIYHKALRDYVLNQIQSFSKSLKRRKLSLRLAEYSKIEELTPEILNAVIERIEIGHVGRKSKIGNVVRIYWRLK